MSKDKIIGKLILEATVINQSPMLIANGQDDDTDFELIKDKDGKPFIPATGFAGMIRSYMPATKGSLWEYLWGSEGDQDTNTIQSHIIIDDLRIKQDSTYNICIRDGVKIDHEKNIAGEGNKYDYEVLEEGAKFSLRIEITVREGKIINDILPYIKWITEQGEQEKFQQGAFKSNGFGIIQIKDPKLYQFDFTDKTKKDGEAWLRFLKLEEPDSIQLNKIVATDKIAEKHILKISGQFTIKNSLIIGSTFIDDKVDKNKSPDKTHLKDSKGIPLLTGKSIKGAIRHRALKILNTIGKSNTLNIIDDLFGNVNEESKKIERSRIKSFESKIKNAEKDQLQPRIKIDRFTQGTIDSALMKSQPLWHKAEIVEITLEIENCRQEEAGLLLLVMSDLMNEDLPIGGEKAIGRGVLTGIALNLNGSILKDGKPSEGQNAETIPVELSFNKAGITDRDKTETVNSWIHKLNENY